MSLLSQGIRPSFRFQLISILVLLTCAPSIDAQTTTYAWNQTGSGNWSTASWLNATPATNTGAILAFGSNYLPGAPLGTSFTATDDLTGQFGLGGFVFNGNSTGLSTLSAITIASTSPATGLT